VLREIDAEAAQLTASRDAKAGELTAQLAATTDERKVTVQDVPGDLVALYEKVRAQKGGVGAAALVRRRCTGCSLDLTAADLGAIAKAPLDEVLRCEECNRILVRTSESGI
jgi:predicted  nucleic acid-binding Zn-ribbon protein